MPVCWKLNDCAVALCFTTWYCLMFLTGMGVCSAVSWPWLPPSDCSSASSSRLFFHCFRLGTGSPYAVKAFIVKFSCIISLLDDWVCRPGYQVWLHWSLRPSSGAHGHTVNYIFPSVPSIVYLCPPFNRVIKGILQPKKQPTNQPPNQLSRHKIERGETGVLKTSIISMLEDLK